MNRGPRIHPLLALLALASGCERDAEPAGEAQPDPASPPAASGPADDREPPPKLDMTIRVMSEARDWRALQAGGLMSCGLDALGEVECWVGKGMQEAEAPAGPFTSISPGIEHVCGLRQDGAIACWGDDFAGALDAPAGRFVQLDAGLNGACAIADDGSPHCWGWNDRGQAEPPEGPFTELAYGYSHACGLRPDGSIACWGANQDGQCDPPEGRYTSVDVGGCFSVALASDGSLRSWGCDLVPPNPVAGADAPRNEPPEESGWIAVTAGYQHACALHQDGHLACWGHDAVNQTNPPKDAFTSVSANFYHNCGLRQDGAPVCWGWDALAGWDPELAGAQVRPAKGEIELPPRELHHTCPYEGLGMIYMQQQRSEAAKRTFERGIEINPDVEYRKFLGLAQLYLAEGDEDAAVPLLRKAATLHPLDPTAAELLAEIVSAEP